MSDDSHESSAAIFSAYTANLRPLRGTGTPTASGLSNSLSGSLAADSLLEQFDRAQQYVARHKEDFSAERLESVQGWAEAARSAQRGNDSTLAAAAMYVVQVTQANALWASEHDTAFISPDAMMRDVQRCPSVRCLMDLKDCLDFCSTSWVSLFCQLGGADLLLQALDAHAEAAEEGGSLEAREALLASLQCVHALMSGAAGMRGMLSVQGCIPRMCALLAHSHTDAAKLVVEMLIKLCLFSADGYRLAVKGLLGEEAADACASPSEAAGGSAAASSPAPKRAPASVPPPPPPPPPRAVKAAPKAPPHPPMSPSPTAVKQPSDRDQVSSSSAPEAARLTPGKLVHASEEFSLRPQQKDAASVETEGRRSSCEGASVLQQHCSSLISLLKVDTAGKGGDFELCDHIISFLNAALTSPEAQANLPQRKRFTNALLDGGLLNVLADIYSLLDPYMNASIDVLRANIKDVIAAPKPAAAPPAPAGAPAKPAPPPPPPPKGLQKGPARLPQPPKARVDAGPAPGRKMKSFFWDKLPDSRVEGTFWAAHPPAYSSLNVQEVEDLFQVQQLQKARAKESPLKQLTVLELKRATAIGIRMAGLKVHWSKAAEAVMRLDSAVLAGAEDTATLLACVPTEEERSMFEAFLHSGGRADALSDAERFCLDLMQVPRIRGRLATYAASFEALAQLQEASSVLAAHRAAHAELAGSGCFAAALEAALALGNFLNHGGRLGQAAGFRLKNLPKLQDTRSRDGRMTLLRYIAAQLCSRDPPHALLSDEAAHVVSPALQTSLSEVAEVLERVGAAAAEMAREAQATPPAARLRLHVAANGQQVSVQLLPDNYHDAMTASLQEVRQRLEGTKGTLQAARDSFSWLLAYYGENAAALVSDGEFWRDLTAFVHAFSRAQREIMQQRQEQEQRQARQQMQAARQTAKCATAAPAKARINGTLKGNVKPDAAAKGELMQPLVLGATPPLEQTRKSEGSLEHNIDQHAAGEEGLCSNGIKPARRDVPSQAIDVHATTSGTCSGGAVKGSACKLRGSVGSGSECLVDSAEDLEQLLGQLVGRAEGLHGSVRAQET